MSTVAKVGIAAVLVMLVGTSVSVWRQRRTGQERDLRREIAVNAERIAGLERKIEVLELESEFLRQLYVEVCKP